MLMYLKIYNLDDLSNFCLKFGVIFFSIGSLALCIATAMEKELHFVFGYSIYASLLLILLWGMLECLIIPFVKRKEIKLKTKENKK